VPVRLIPYQSCHNTNGCILYEDLADGSFRMISIDDPFSQRQEGEAVGSSTIILGARTEVECITSVKRIFLTERQPNHIVLIERRPRGGDGDDIIKMDEFNGKTGNMSADAFEWICILVGLFYSLCSGQ
jgi:hypothetical protein